MKEGDCEIEDEWTEFKKDVSNSISKAAVAFSNTDGGQILIGIDDNGKVTGVKDADEVVKTCAQILRDTVRPDITMTTRLRIIDIEDEKVVRIDVPEGSSKPYFLMGEGLSAEGVYVRRGISNQLVSEETFQQMICDIHGRTFETSHALNQELTFKDATSIFREAGLSFDESYMKILGVLDDDGYTNLGWMLSDQFDVQIKIGVFTDEHRSCFLARGEYSGSILSQFNSAFSFILGQTGRSSIINGINRIGQVEFPEMAVREALLNAVIHRDYTISGPILVSLYPGKLLIASPGGQNGPYSLEDLKLGVSSSRNPKTANVFYRLGLVETYGSGIPRMFDLYRGHASPEFKISSSVFFVSLPSLFFDAPAGIDKILAERRQFTRSDLEKEGYTRGEALKILNSLEVCGKIKRVGGGRSSHYVIL